MNFNYLMPTQIYFGENVIWKNKETFTSIGRKALIITGKGSAKKITWIL